jgi:hypothetical protein
VRTQEPLASAWLQAFLDFERPDQVLSADIVETFLAKIATPAQLMDLVEQLMHEGTLLRWDGHQVQEHLLTHVDHTGQWKYHPPRKGVL